MTYEELKKAYEESLQKCSELEKEIEDKDLRIEHLTELLIKQNKMLFGQKSEKGKYICDGQLSLDGIVFNEAEEHSDFNIPEPTADTIVKKSKKTGKHRGRKEIRADLETKKVVYELPQDEQICSVCGEPLYAYRESRSKKVAEELLKGYTGVVQIDGFQSYGSGEYKHSGCWSHLRRKVVDCIPKGDKNCISAKIVALIDKAFYYERELRKHQCSAKQILSVRKNKIKPLLDQIYDIIGTLRTSKDSHLSTAVTYARNQKEKLYYFLDDPNVEMTNNLAEQTVKSYVINRKNFLFSDTEKGADASAAVMSIIETAKRNKLDVYGYLTYLLTVLPEWGKNPTDEQLESVMPWSESLPDFCRQEYDEIKR